MRGIARPLRSSVALACTPSRSASDRHGTSAPRTLATPCSTRERWCGSECTACSGAISVKQAVGSASHSSPRRNSSMERPVFSSTGGAAAAWCSCISA
ncbi:hypothetical protein D9M71_631650 [compost metagenome]